MPPQLPPNLLQNHQRRRRPHPAPHQAFAKLNRPFRVRLHVVSTLRTHTRHETRDGIFAFEVLAEVAEEGLQAGYADGAGAVELTRAEDDEVGAVEEGADGDFVGLGGPGRVG